MDLINVLACDNLIPDGVAGIVSMIVKVIQIVVPILLIIWGMLDFAKAVVGGDEDKIKAAQKIFIKRLIAALVVFLIITIVQLVIGIIQEATTGTEGAQAGNAWDCASELINGKKS